MCTACGLCQAIAGQDVIKVSLQNDGYIRPEVVGDLNQGTLDKISQICPGINVSLDQRREPDADCDTIWGQYHELVVAWAAQPAVRHLASTGGALTGLAQYLVASEEVDFVLHVKASMSDPVGGEPHLSFTDADVISAAGSRYAPVAPLLHLVDLLDKGQPFAVIGKPCDISAINNYAKIDTRVDMLIRYRLTMVCGGYLTPSSLDGFLSRAGMPRNTLSSLRYRGHGCPGPVEITNQQGTTIQRSYNDFWGETEDSWSIPFRCKICTDGIGEGADIAAADTWPNCQVDAATEHLDPGSNALIVRTSRGKELLSRAIEHGFVERGEDLTLEDLNNFQLHQVVKKQAAQARIEGLKAAGGIGIRGGGTRQQAASEQCSAEFYKQQKAGTMQRFLSGERD